MDPETSVIWSHTDESDEGYCNFRTGWFGLWQIFLQVSVTQTINSLLDILGMDQRQSKCQCAKCLILTIFNNHQFCGSIGNPVLTTVAIVAVCVSSFR